jgi:hypothetical protein
VEELFDSYQQIEEIKKGMAPLTPRQAIPVVYRICDEKPTVAAVRSSAAWRRYLQSSTTGIG